jgi:hypothetical protein
MAAILLIAIGVGALLWHFKSSTTQTQESDGNMTLADKLRASAIPEYSKPYVDDIVAAAEATQPTDYNDGLEAWAKLLIAVADHESKFGNAVGYSPRGSPEGWGDGGNAFGFWQIDKHYHGAFIYSDDVSIKAQAEYAGSILKENWQRFAEYDQRTGLMLSAYNASPSRINRMLDDGATFAEVDATTTQRSGHGYGQSVLLKYADYNA